MHDPTSLFRFEEHDIYLPILTLEELDNNKKGMTEVARNARQASRFLDELVTARAISDGTRRRHPARSRTSGGAATGRLFLQTEAITTALPPSLADGKADNQIIAVVMHLQQPHPKRNVILVSQGHQHAHQGACAGHRRRGLLQRQGARGHRPALQRHARAAGGFLGPARQGHGIVAAGRPHLLPRHRAAVPSTCWSTNSSTRKQGPGRDAALRDGQGNHRAHRAAADAEGLHAPEEQRLGHHRAQPRAELRAQPADESRDRLRHAARPGRHRQDAADARRRPDADARIQGLLRDHHDARHGAGRRGHRLPARHRGREDEPVDGRARGQSRRAQQDRRRGRRMGPRRDARPDPLAHQGEVAQLHARPHLHQQVPDHRRGAEPDAEADEDADHARRARAPRSCASATSRRSTRRT